MVRGAKKAGRPPPARRRAHEVNSIAPGVATAPRVAPVPRAGLATAMRPPVGAPTRTVRRWTTAPPRRPGGPQVPDRPNGFEGSRPKKDASARYRQLDLPFER